MLLCQGVLLNTSTLEKMSNTDPTKTNGGGGGAQMTSGVISRASTAACGVEHILPIHRSTENIYHQFRYKNIML